MYSVIHWDGSSEGAPPLSSLSALFDELLVADREHGDVTVVHEESGWSLSAHRDGRVVLEHLSEGGERHMKPVTKERVLELWLCLVRDDLETLFSASWQPGYGTKGPLQ